MENRKMKNIKIKAKPVERPYLLSNIALVFGFREDRLVAALSMLAGQGMIYSHDIEAIKNGDYKISGYALSVLLLEGKKDIDPQLLRDMLNYVESVTGTHPCGDSATNYVVVKALAMKLQTIELERQHDEIKKFNKALDSIMNMPAVNGTPY